MRRNPERRKAKMLAKWEMILRGCDYQPPVSSVCGQIAVATIVGRPLLEVLGVFGKDTRTNKGMLATALAHYGFAMNMTAQRKRPEPGQLAIGTARQLVIKNDGPEGWRGNHWIIWLGDDWFDAVVRDFFQRDHFNETWKPKTWHIIERTSDNGTAVPLTETGGPGKMRT